MKVIDERRSIREYSKNVISDEDIQKILKAAMQAPSARNQQPWEFLVVKNVLKREKISQALKTCYMAKDSQFVIIFLTNKGNLKTESMYPADMSASVTTSLLEACSLKIGSCWCGIYPNQERMNIVKDIFEIKNELLEPFALVCYGYPVDNSSFKYINRYSKDKVHFEVI